MRLCSGESSLARFLSPLLWRCLLYFDTPAHLADAPGLLRGSAMPEIARTSTHPAHRNPVRLFIRIKDLRDVDPKHESFNCRFRLFAYFSDAQVEEQLLADHKEESLSTLAARHFKVKLSQLSPQVQDLLPHVMLQNKVSQESFHGAEFMVKPHATTGFHFCLTEEFALRLNHEYDMRNFPFDQHAPAVRAGVNGWSPVRVDVRPRHRPCFTRDDVQPQHLLVAGDVEQRATIGDEGDAPIADALQAAER